MATGKSFRLPLTCPTVHIRRPITIGALAGRVHLYGALELLAASSYRPRLTYTVPGRCGPIGGVGVEGHGMLTGLVALSNRSGSWVASYLAQ